MRSINPDILRLIALYTPVDHVAGLAKKAREKLAEIDHEAAESIQFEKDPQRDSRDFSLNPGNILDWIESLERPEMNAVVGDLAADEPTVWEPAGRDDPAKLTALKLLKSFVATVGRRE